jgi:hypothetical protein
MIQVKVHYSFCQRLPSKRKKEEEKEKKKGRKKKKKKKKIEATASLPSKRKTRRVPGYLPAHILHQAILTLTWRRHRRNIELEIERQRVP